MFKILILMAAIVFSTVSYGTPGLALARKLIERGYYEQAATVIRTMGLPFNHFLPDELHEDNYQRIHKTGRKLGYSFDEIELTLSQRHFNSWVIHHLEAETINDLFPEIIETWMEHGMKLDIERVKFIIAELERPDVDLDVDRIKDIIKFMHDHMEE